MKAYNRADAIWVYTPQQVHNVPAQMKPLHPPDSFFVQGARGWLELGNVNEAQAELDKVRAKKRDHPDVLEVLWEICARRGDWDRCVELGTELIDAAPARLQGYIQRAYALHRVKRTQDAWDVLFPVAEKFPTDATIKYNLACYATQLGRLWEGEQWLKLAFTIGNEQKLRSLALQDPDLKPLWGKLDRI